MAENSIPLTILRAIDLVFSLSQLAQLESDEANAQLIPFTITGPSHAVSVLSDELGPQGLTGWCSPYAPVTLTGADREAAGIPEQAKYFTFIYPLQATQGRFELLIARARCARRVSSPPVHCYLSVHGVCPPTALT